MSHGLSKLSLHMRCGRYTVLKGLIPSTGGSSIQSRCLFLSPSMLEEKLYPDEIAERRPKADILDPKHVFESSQEKSRQTFKNALEIFTKRDKRRRGAVEFIETAMRYMKQYGVHRDIESYKALINVMPKGQYVPQNFIQVDFWHYPKQQDCIVKVLHQMDSNSVMPDEELGDLIEAIFGLYSKPMKKYMRMLYWCRKFKNLSPWPLPTEVPNDPLELAKLAIERITSVDRLTKLTVYDTEDIPESVEKTWIVSGQSQIQKDLIPTLPKEKALYLEGGFRVWLRGSQVTYFILRGEPSVSALLPEESTKADIDDVSNYKMWIYGEVADEQDLVPLPTVHEQIDGTIYACCATGTSNRDSLLSWIRFLQRENPGLENIPILFSLHSPLGAIVPLSEEELNPVPLSS